MSARNPSGGMGIAGDPSRSWALISSLWVAPGGAAGTSGRQLRRAPNERLKARECREFLERRQPVSARGRRGWPRRNCHFCRLPARAYACHAVALLAAPRDRTRKPDALHDDGVNGAAIMRGARRARRGPARGFEVRDSIHRPTASTTGHQVTDNRIPLRSRDRIGDTRTRARSGRRYSVACMRASIQIPIAAPPPKPAGRAIYAAHAASSSPQTFRPATAALTSPAATPNRAPFTIESCRFAVQTSPAGTMTARSPSTSVIAVGEISTMMPSTRRPCTSLTCTASPTLRSVRVFDMGSAFGAATHPKWMPPAIKTNKTAHIVPSIIAPNTRRTSTTTDPLPTCASVRNPS